MTNSKIARVVFPQQPRYRVKRKISMTQDLQYGLLSSVPMIGQRFASEASIVAISYKVPESASQILAVRSEHVVMSMDPLGLNSTAEYHQRVMF